MAFSVGSLMEGIAGAGVAFRVVVEGGREAKTPSSINRSDCAASSLLAAIRTLGSSISTRLSGGATGARRSRARWSSLLLMLEGRSEGDVTEGGRKET
jgi:hypothetical protein